MRAIALAAAEDVPDGDGWLGAGERAVLEGLRVAKRRADWRSGRWAARQAVAAGTGVEPRSVSVLAAADGAPAAFTAGAPAAVTVSITHSRGRAACLVAEPGAAAGCDLEAVEPRAGAFAREWFTAAERAAVAAAGESGRDLVTTVIWSGKESALKARRCGLRGDARRVEVSLPTGRAVAGWSPMTVCDLEAGTTAAGWWRRLGELVLTAVISPDGPPPRLLRAPPDQWLVRDDERPCRLP